MQERRVLQAKAERLLHQQRMELRSLRQDIAGLYAGGEGQQEAPEAKQGQRLTPDQGGGPA